MLLKSCPGDHITNFIKLSPPNQNNVTPFGFSLYLKTCILQKLPPNKKYSSVQQGRNKGNSKGIGIRI